MLDVTTKLDIKVRGATADDIPVLRAAVRAIGQQNTTAVMTGGDWARELSRGNLNAYIAIIDNRPEPVGVLGRSCLAQQSRANSGPATRLRDKQSDHQHGASPGTRIWYP